MKNIGQVGSPGTKSGSFSECEFTTPMGVCCMKGKPIAFVTDLHTHCISSIDFVKEEVAFIAGKMNVHGIVDGIGSQSEWNSPYGIAIHNQQKTLYVTDNYNNLIRSIDISDMDFTVQTVCGKNYTRGYKDGIGSSAELSGPSGLCFSSLNENILFFCDSINNTIRRLDVITRGVVTIAGIRNHIGHGDGIGIQAIFHAPKGICADKFDNLYICDRFNNVIRKMHKKNSLVSTIGIVDSKGGMQDGDQYVATFQQPHFIIYDRNTNCLYLTQMHSLRKIRLSDALVMRLCLIHRLLFRKGVNQLSPLKSLLLRLVSFEILRSSRSIRGFSSRNQLIEKMTQHLDKIINYIDTAKQLDQAAKTAFFEAVF